MWTSGAQSAHWMVLLARTDPDASKHQGISSFLLNMKTPGITVRPLVLMNIMDFVGKGQPLTRQGLTAVP